MSPFEILLYVAGQHAEVESVVPALIAADPVLWPYFVAIATLSATCGTLWVAYVKANRDHAAELKSMHVDYRKADEEKTRRQAEESTRKDASLLDISVKTADVLARVEGSIRESTDALKKLQEDLKEALRAQTR